jgi:hypothetical protein
MKTPVLLSVLIGCSLPLIATDSTAPDILPLGTFQPASSWRFSNGAEFAGAKGALTFRATTSGDESAISFDFSGGGAYVSASTPITITDDYAELRVRVKSTKNMKLAFRINDYTGQCHQIPVSYDRAGEWQTIRYDLKAHRPGQHWGGVNDGVLNFPLTSFTIVVPNPKTEMATGILLFSDAKALR